MEICFFFPELSAVTFIFTQIKLERVIPPAANYMYVSLYQRKKGYMTVSLQLSRWRTFFKIRNDMMHDAFCVTVM